MDRITNKDCFNFENPGCYGSVPASWSRGWVFESRWTLALFSSYFLSDFNFIINHNVPNQLPQGVSWFWNDGKVKQRNNTSYADWSKKALIGFKKRICAISPWSHKDWQIHTLGIQVHFWQVTCSYSYLPTRALYLNVKCSATQAFYNGNKKL